MAEGNGVDLASLAAMMQVLVEGQEKLRVEFRQELHELRLEVRQGLFDVRTELRFEIAELRNETRERFASLEARLHDYHGAVIGHGILITELQEDVRELKTRLPGPS